MTSDSIEYSDHPVDDSTPLLNHEPVEERPHWPRNRELGWLIPYGLRYPPPVLPRSLRGLQADLDSAWMELERQHVIANRVNLLTSSMALLITSSGGLTTALANSKNGRIWTSITGMLTTLAGTIMGGMRAMGQPRRAEDRVRRLERIIDHIGRLYYTIDPNAERTLTHDRAVEETWKMIDDEEERTELEERKSGHFDYQVQASVPSSSSVLPIDQCPKNSSLTDHDDSSDSNQQIRPRLKMRRASTLLGDHYSSASIRRAP